MLLKNIVISEHRTSMRLEREVWDALFECCRDKNISLNKLCLQVEKTKGKRGLSSAMRVYALNYYRELVEKYRKGEEK